MFHEKNCDKVKTFTVNHFATEGVSRSTLFDILKRKQDGISSERQSSSGRPAKIMTKRNKAACEAFLSQMWD